MRGISQILGILRPSPATGALPSTAVVLLMSGLCPPAAASGLLGLQKLLDGTEGCRDEGDLAEKVGLEDGKGDDAEEKGDESSELELQQSQDGEQLLQLLLLLATAWAKQRQFSF